MGPVSTDVERPVLARLESVFHAFIHSRTPLIPTITTVGFGHGRRCFVVGSCEFAKFCHVQAPLLLRDFGPVRPDEDFAYPISGLLGADAVLSAFCFPLLENMPEVAPPDFGIIGLLPRRGIVKPLSLKNRILRV